MSRFNDEELHTALERAIRELEGKLPELRRLIAEAELTFAMSDEAEQAGRTFLDALTQADERATTLRRLLLGLGGTLPGTGETSQSAPQETPALPVADPEQQLTELEAKLGMNELVEASPTTPGLIRTLYLPFDTDLWSVYPLREPVREGWDVKRIFAISAPDEAQYLLVLDERPHALEDAPEDKTNRQKWLDTRIVVLEFDGEASREAYVQTIVQAARSARDTKRAERRATFDYLSEYSNSPRTFAELRERYREIFTKTIEFYVDDISEARLVVRQTFEQAERVWYAADGEVSGLDLLARVAKNQIERLLPRPLPNTQRYIPTEEQIFRRLETWRIERVIESLNAKLAALQAEGENITNAPMVQELQTVRDELISRFFNAKLPLDDDNEAGGAIGVPVMLPPPRKGPGGGRTFEEALALPRNP